MKFKLITVFFLFLFQTLLLAQNEKAIDIFNNRNENLNKAVKDLSVLKKSAKANESQLLLNSLLALTYITRKDYESAKKYITEAEKFSNTNGSSSGEAYYNFATGKLYMILEINDKSINYFLKSFRLFKLNDNFAMASDAGVSVFYISSYKDVKILNESLELADRSKDVGAIINARCGFANYMKNDFNTNRASKYNSDQLLKYLKETADLIQNENETTQKFALASLYFNYGYNLLFYNKNPEGDVYLNKALKLAKKYNYLSIYRNYYGAKGDILLEENRIDEAKAFFYRGLKEAQEMPYPDVVTELLFYDDLKKIAATQKDWEEFYRIDQLFQAASKKANDENVNKAIQNSIIKYEMKEKEEKIETLTSKNFNQRIYILIMIVVMVLMLIIWFQYQKNNKLKMHLISEKNKQLEIERNQVRKELIGSVLHLEKKNEILNNLKEKLMEKKSAAPSVIDHQIFKAIEEGILVDDDFEKFRSNFNTIYPEFFNKLLDKANQNLTQLDLKYCGFILMKLSTKEIASQMNVEPKSIRMARYRIKQKLNLGKDEDLDQFIQHLS